MTLPEKAYDARILLVEDYEANVLVATTYLEMFGYACDVASNAQEAIDKCAGTRYAAVLMDVELGIGMNGLEATRAIRAHEAENNLPPLSIIGMTAHAMAGDRQRCIEAGMDDYLSKPFNPDDFQEKLERLRAKTAAF